MSSNEDKRMELRVKSIEERMKVLEAQVNELTDALLGTLDGKPGALIAMHRALELCESHAVQLESLKLDRAKVAGIIVACVAMFGLVYKFVLK